MFTGLIEEIGEIVAVTPVGDSLRLTVKGPKVTEDAGHGDADEGEDDRDVVDRGAATARREVSQRDRREEREEDLRDMVHRVSESEQIEDEERELLQSVFELGRTLTREVMVPRTDMVTIDADQPLGKAITLFTRSGSIMPSTRPPSARRGR